MEARTPEKNSKEKGMPETRSSAEYTADNLPTTIPILPLYDSALFPKMVLPLVVMQEDSIKLVDEAMSKNRIIGLVVTRKEGSEPPDPEKDMASVGCSALILKMAKNEDNRSQMLVQGLSRFRITSFVQTKPYMLAEVEYFEDIERIDKETEALMANVIKQFGRIVELSPGLPPEIGQMAASIKEPGTLADMVTSTINSSPEEKQQILDERNANKRLKLVTKMVNHQLDILELGNKIQSQVKGDMDKRQREYYLRQQLKAIKEELGETDEETVEIDEYRTKIQEAGLTEEAVKEAERELSRLAKMHPSSAEYTVTSTYLDWLTELPLAEAHRRQPGHQEGPQGAGR